MNIMMYVTIMIIIIIMININQMILILNMILIIVMNVLSQKMWIMKIYLLSDTEERDNKYLHI